jgi:hypothetical protein
MQRVILHQSDIMQVQSQANRLLPSHGAGVQEPAVNDDLFDDENNIFWLVFSVLGNVIGGTIFLYILFLLPHVVARLIY